jgi:hypothetical protein
MMLYISLPLPIMFLLWVTSGEYKWVTLAKRRCLRSIAKPNPRPFPAESGDWFGPGTQMTRHRCRSWQLFAGRGGDAIPTVVSRLTGD